MDGKKLANGDKYRGEALFLRSWWYFSLYRVFGGVPVTTTVVSPADAKTIARCSDEDMYNRLTQDLSEAISLLPAKGQPRLQGNQDCSTDTACQGLSHFRKIS